MAGKIYTPAGQAVDEGDRATHYSMRVERRRIAGTKDFEDKLLCYATPHLADGTPVNTSGVWADQVLTLAEQTQLTSILAKLRAASMSGSEFKDS